MYATRQKTDSDTAPQKLGVLEKCSCGRSRYDFRKRLRLVRGHLCKHLLKGSSVANIKSDVGRLRCCCCPFPFPFPFQGLELPSSDVDVVVCGVNGLNFSYGGSRAGYSSVQTVANLQKLANVLQEQSWVRGMKVMLTLVCTSSAIDKHRVCIFCVCVCVYVCVRGGGGGGGEVEFSKKHVMFLVFFVS